MTIAATRVGQTPTPSTSCSRCGRRRERTYRATDAGSCMSCRGGGRHPQGSWGWQDDAACTGAPLDVFFPRAAVDAMSALVVCAGCPVRAECLRHALDHREQGVWGGTTDEQRRLMRRRGRHETLTQERP